MAALSSDAGGLKRIVFKRPDGSGRTTIRLGKVSLKAGQSFKTKVEAIVAAKTMRESVDHQTAQWVADLPDPLHAKIAKAGLVEPREVSDDTLAGLIDRFVEQADVTNATLAAYRQTTGSLLDFFGGALLVSKLTESDADEWRQSLVESKLAPATVAKRCHVAKNILSKAVRWGMIDRSPFKDLRTGSQTNPGRSVYVNRETIAKVLDACPDAYWRAIVGLARYAGLRTPSEPALLCWGDINWDLCRMTVHSPKTARHEGHGSRVVPIAPELGAILMDLFHEADDGEDRVLPGLQASANLRTTFLKIIARAGETPWPRLFHNLRASCATDWVERFPNHVVAKWVGHTPMIAATHYLQTRDVHFDLAAGLSKSVTESVTLLAQNPPQRGATQKDADRQDIQETLQNKAILPVCDRRRPSVQNQKVGGVGLEPTTTRV